MRMDAYVTQGADEPQADSKDDGPVEWISYWKPNITINLVDDFTRYVARLLQHSNGILLLVLWFQT